MNNHVAMEVTVESVDSAAISGREPLAEHFLVRVHEWLHHRRWQPAPLHVSRGTRGQVVLGGGHSREW